MGHLGLATFIVVYILEAETNIRVSQLPILKSSFGYTLFGSRSLTHSLTWERAVICDRWNQGALLAWARCGNMITSYVTEAGAAKHDCQWSKPWGFVLAIACHDSLGLP